MWVDCRVPAQLSFFFEDDFDKSPPVGLGRLLSANEGDENFLSKECDESFLSNEGDESFLLEESDDASMLLCRL